MTVPYLYTKEADGTIRNIGDEISSTLAKLYKSRNISLEDMQQIHINSTPPKESQAYEVWIKLSAEAEDKYKRMINS